MKQRRVTHRRLRDSNCALSEWESEAARPAFLLHGWGDCGSSFQPLVDRLTSELRWVAPDWRGFGDSSWSTSGYWFADYLADLESLLDSFNLAEPAVLVGHSMGGNISALYAGIRPDRVAAVVTIEGFGLPNAEPAQAPDRYADWLDSVAAPEPQRLYDSLDALAARIRRLHPTLSERLALFLAKQWTRNGTEGYELKADPAHRRPNPVLYRRAEAEACWNRIQAPVLRIAGRESKWARGLTSEPIAVREPGGHPIRTTVISGAGHMVHIEEPAKVAAEIDEALKEWL